MKLPLITYDIFLAADAPAVLTVYREDTASRIVEFLATLASARTAVLPNERGDEKPRPIAPFYTSTSRVVETQFTSLAEVSAAYLTLDEGLMTRVLDEAVAKHEAERERAADVPAELVADVPKT